MYVVAGCEYSRDWHNKDSRTFPTLSLSCQEYRHSREDRMAAQEQLHSQHCEIQTHLLHKKQAAALLGSS